MILIKERVGKLIEEVQKAIYGESLPIDSYKMKKTNVRLENEGCPDTSSWELLGREEIWGGHREMFYFETEAAIPSHWEGQTVVYRLRTGKEGEWNALNPQFLAYVNGQKRHGLDVNHREILLSSQAVPGERFRILLAAYTGDHNFSLRMDSQFQILYRDVEKYFYDLSVPYETARLLPKDSQEYLDIIQALNESLNLLDMRQIHSPMFFESLKKAQAYLTENFYQKKCGHKDPLISCVGHTHIDCAWLWTLKTTEDKAVRSFSTVLELMDQYPEYIFMSSQPQLYKYVQKNAPDIYQKIKERVAQGRWEPEGGMFVEADCNLASGEALVRQFLYGTRFFEKEFGKKNQILWLPDVFGYSAALPQIMKKCGIRYFMTTKISWNELNKMPYDTFYWEGIDGTKILTHFSPSRDFGAQAVEGGAETEHFTTYNAMLGPSMVKGAWQRYSQKYLNSQALMSYGYGDGGGGPTREMLENQRRLSQGIPGCPRTEPSTAADFFHNLEKDVSSAKYMPTWTGELYLEYHRGTYTSMARNKKYNRRAEFSCENLEFYSVLSKLLTDSPYPKQELRDAWEVTLRNQFHDILPGSSIKEVYEDSQKEYEELLHSNQDHTEALLEKMADSISAGEGSLVIFNPNSSSHPAPMTLAKELLPETAKNPILVPLSEAPFGSPIPLQKTKEGWVGIVSGLPPKGYAAYQVTEILGGSHQEEFSVTKERIETPYFHISLNQSGHFTSIYDKRVQRELLTKGELGNRIISYEDRPHNFDAWDINNYYKEKSWPVDEVTSIQVVEEGPIRGAIKIQRPYLNSVIVQYLYFYRDLPQIDIRNEIDWKESQILLRTYFPVDIHANEATYEIQYGNVQRPTHTNTSWDFAKFEVCAHKWLDYSETGYGVSILNDCKYGCDVHDSVIGLSMLKSGIHPNPDADKEHHTFWYSICPHTGTFREGETVQKAYALNNPCQAVVKHTSSFGPLPASYSLIRTDRPNVIIQAVKEEEEGDHLIVRLYEYQNQRSQVRLTFGFPVESCTECNMLEREDTPVSFTEDTLTFEIRPFEIRTFKITKKKSPALAF